MLRGDLASSPLEHLLAELATDAATGCLYIADPEGGDVHLYVANGQLVGVRPVPSRDPLGPRLVSAGLLDVEQLSAAVSTLDAGSRPASLADVLLEQANAEPAHLDEVAEELALDTVERIDRWTSGAWRFRRRLQPVRPLSDPISCAHLVQLVAGRRTERDELARRLASEGLSLAELVPTVDQLPEVADEAGLPAIVRRFVDGQRCLGEVARLTGYSELALGRLLAEQREAAEQQEREAAEARAAQAMEAVEPSTDTVETREEASADEPALGDDTSDHDAPAHLSPADLTLDDLTPTDSWNRIAGDEEVGASLAKASEALSQLMGEGLVEEEPETSLQPVRSSRASAPAPVEPAEREAAARRERLRAAAAAELAAAHAEAEEARRAAEASPTRTRESGDAESVEPSVTPLRPATLEGARAAQAALSLLSQDTVPPVAEPRTGPAVTPLTEQDPAAPRSTQPRNAVPAQRSVAHTADSQLAAALLREMASERLGGPAVTVDGPAAALPSNPDVAVAALPSGPRMGISRPTAPSGAADTAALLRELSSLGGEEAGPGGPRPGQRPAPGSASGPAGGRRRKGLWGRG